MRSLPYRGGVLIPLVLVLLGTLFLFTAQASIVVKPGKLDRFVITIITDPVAGEYFLAKLEAYDTWDNFITEYTGPGGGFSIKVNGQARVTPSTIKARDFSGGSVVKIIDERAEEIELSIYEEGGSVPITTHRVTVRPNKMDHFQVTVPGDISAGDTFQVRILARDVFENLIPEYANGGEIRVDFVGEGTAVSLGGIQPTFEQGEAVLDFTAEGAGGLKLVVRDMTTNSEGSSEILKIDASIPDHFVIVAPRAVVAGEKFPLTITVFDRFENPILDYGSQGEEVILTSSTGSRVMPDSLTAGTFKKGRAEFKASYQKAEPFQLRVEGKNEGPLGTSETIVASPAGPHNFVISTPDTAIAGEGFTAIIEAMDRYSNLVTDFHLIGSEVFLTTDGSGELSPSSISPSLFQGGRAEVLLSYSRAESFNLMADMKGEGKKRRPVREMTGDEKEKLEAERAKRELEAKMRSQKEKEKVMALKAKDEAISARRESEEATAREEESRKREALQKSQAEKARQEALRLQEEETEADKREEAVKAKQEAIEAMKKDEEQAGETAGKPSDKDAPIVIAEAAVQRLEGISVVEAENQSMVILKLSGPVNYDVNMSSSLARQWIFINLSPAERDPGEVPAEMSVESSLVGEITTTEKGNRNLEVAVMLIPKNITYTVEQDGKAIVIKISQAQ